MERTNTPCDDGITDGLNIISYVANNEGSQELVPGSVWHPVNVVNRQAWQEIDRQIASSKALVAAGRVSCLHYYMTANQMDTGLLAKYTGQSRWLVRLHMVPFFFNRLRADALARYGEIFQVSREDLMQGRLLPAIYNRRGVEVRPDA